MPLTKTTYSMIAGSVANVLDFGAVGDDSADCTAAFQAALASPATTIFVPYGIYRISGPIVYGKAGQKIVGENGGPFSIYTTMIKYTGVTTVSPMFTVPRGYSNCGIESIRLNANLLADICFQVIGVAGTPDATHCPFFRNMSFVGYRTRGLILGLNSTTAICADQLNMVTMDKIMFEGGVVGAIGMLVNAQNLEYAVINNLSFQPGGGAEHLNHIYCYTGGLNIQGLVSTRATDYAIITQSSQVIINGWRSEDVLGLKVIPVGGTGPSFISGVTARKAGLDPTNLWIDFAGTEGPITLISCKLGASVAIEPTAEKQFTALNVAFAAGAGYLVYGPTNLRGILHEADTGVVQLYGTAPKISILLNDGTTGIDVERQQIKFNQSLAAASAANKSLFVDSADDVLKYKDVAGAIHSLY